MCKVRERVCAHSAAYLTAQLSERLLTATRWLFCPCCLSPTIHASPQSPYRDQHGQDWSTSNWGRPLTLRADVFASLSSLWAGCGFDFDSYILHHAEAVPPRRHGE